jgi:hypothetical protein
LMIVCPLPLRVVEREAIVPGTADDENNAADLPVTFRGHPRIQGPAARFLANPAYANSSNISDNPS